MIPDILLLIIAVAVPLVVRSRWLVTILVLAASAVRGMIGWRAGLEEDVPPLLILFGFASLGVVALIVAVAVHATKEWYLKRRMKKSS